MTDKKTNIIGIRVSEHDRKILERHAKAEGKSLSDFVRDQVFRGGGRILQGIELPDGTKIPLNQLHQARFVFLSESN